MSTVPTSGPMVRTDTTTPGRTAQAEAHVTTSKGAGNTHSVIVREETALYDLSRLSKYNDPLLIIGFLVVVMSVALAWPPYSLPAAGVLLGAGIMKLAWMMGEVK